MSALRVPRTLGLTSCALVCVIVAAGWALPLITLVFRAGSVGNLLDEEVLAILRATALQASVSTLLSLLIGIPLGLVVATLGPPTSSRIQGLLRIPFSVPTLIAATAWVVCLGRGGPLSVLDISYSFSAVVLAHVFYNAPWVGAQVAQALSAVPDPQLEASRTLGASPAQRFVSLLWPAIAPAVAAATAQVFALCSMSFALVLILGGGPSVSTLETSLYARVRYGALDLPGAIACALWEVLLTALPWALLLLLTRETVSDPSAFHRRARKPAPRARTAFAIAVSILFLLPYFAVFTPGALAAILEVETLGRLAPSAWISLQIATASSLGSVGVAVVFLVAGAWAGQRSHLASRVLALLIAVPSGISVLVLGLGAWLTYERWIDVFSGSLTAMCVVQILLCAPVAYRMLWPLVRASRRRGLEAALTLGASPVRAFFEVEWPRYRGPLLGAVALVAGVSLGEVAAVSLFYSENLIPLPLVVSRWMAQYRFEEAQGLSAVLLVLSMLTVLSSQALEKKHAAA